MKKTIKTILRVVILFATLVAAGYIQLLILQPDMNYVYIGKTVAVWGLCWYILYTSFIGTAIFLGLYNNKK